MRQSFDTCYYTRLFLSLFLFLFTTINLYAQKSYSAGETLTYKAYYHWGVLWLPAASITLNVSTHPDPRYLTIKANGISFKRYDLFFKVREKFEATIAKNTLLPIEAKRSAIEGSYTAEEYYRFNDTANTIHYSINVNNGKTKDAGTIEKADGYFDMLSAAYYMREYDFNKLKVNQKVTVNTIINGKVYPVTIQFMGNEICKDNANRQYYCAKFAASTVPGTVFKGDERIHIWMTRDNVKMPIKITSSLKIGEVNVELSGASGIK